MSDMSDRSQTANLPAIPTRQPAPLSRDIIKEIAIDIGKEVAAHIETMYPKAVEATSSTFLLSVRNCVYNQIMAALETIDEDEIRRRLEDRRAFPVLCSNGHHGNFYMSGHAGDSSAGKLFCPGDRQHHIPLFGSLANPCCSTGGISSRDFLSEWGCRS
jgi:hypothetical protein